MTINGRGNILFRLIKIVQRFVNFENNLLLLMDFVLKSENQKCIHAQSTEYRAQSTKYRAPSRTSALASCISVCGLWGLVGDARPKGTALARTHTPAPCAVGFLSAEPQLVSLRRERQTLVCACVSLAMVT